MSLYEELQRLQSKSAYDARLKLLASQGRNTKLISDGVRQVIENLNGGAKSLVVYGEPQSGKTEFMIALVCKLLDEKRKTIFILMNDNESLEIQNFKRFKRASEIVPSPMTFKQFKDQELQDKKSDLQRIIFCRKNSRNLETLIDEARFLKDRIVIDDEADFASPDSNINKDEPTTINRLVSELGQLPPNGDGTYIGVTATPGRLDLNGTFANDARDWVFLESHEKYKGREFFFPLTRKQREASDFIPVIMKDEGNNSNALKEAVLRFLVRAAILNLEYNHDGPAVGYSMLVHTDGRISVHNEDQAEVQKHLSILKEGKQPKANKYCEVMLDYAEQEIQKRGLNFTGKNVVRFVIEKIGSSSTLIINSAKDKLNVEEGCNPSDVFTFVFGGNIISRGLTFERLLTFYFSRGVKHKLQQNTYIQRARMFGTREYSSYFELCVPESLFSDWADCFFDHQVSLASAKSGNYVHIFGDNTSPADSKSIDKSKAVNVGKEWVLGSAAPLQPSLEETFELNKSKGVFQLIDNLLNDGKLTELSINPGMWSQIKALAEVSGEEPILLMADQGGFLCPSNKDFNHETLIRKRGGLVSQNIKGRPKFSGKQILMPVKNKTSDLVAFYYRNNLGKKVVRIIQGAS